MASSIGAGAPSCETCSMSGVYSSVMVRAAQIAQIIIWAVILVLGVLAYWRYLRLAPMD